MHLPPLQVNKASQSTICCISAKTQQPGSSTVLLTFQAGYDKERVKKKKKVLLKLSNSFQCHVWSSVFMTDKKDRQQQSPFSSLTITCFQESLTPSPVPLAELLSTSYQHLNLFKHAWKIRHVENANLHFYSEGKYFSITSLNGDICYKSDNTPKTQDWLSKLNLGTCLLIKL